MSAVRLRRPHATASGAQAGTLVVGAAACGVAAAAGFGVVVLGAVVMAAAVTAAVLSWRRSLAWMLLYLPVSGLLPLLLYPHGTVGVLLKDLLFVGPAYLGAIVAAARRRERFGVPGVPWLLATGLVVLILVQAFNPRLPNPLVGIVGVRVWLFYLPLLILGYHLVEELGQLQRLLKWMTYAAMVPCVIGIVEAFFVYNGHADAVYGLYGDAAGPATQDFAQFDFGLLRIPSIFTFVAQYWMFTTATVAVAYAAWRGNRTDATMAWFGPVAIAIAALASLTSGARAAFIFTPFLLLLILLLDGLSLSRMLRYAGMCAAATVVALAVLGIQLSPLASSTSDHSSFILSFFGEGFTFARDHALWGMGTGIDSNQARYAFGGSTDYAIVYRDLGGVWYESWYIKAFIELGVLGLILLIANLAALLRRCLMYHRRILGAELRSMSAAFVALFAWTVVYTIKTAYIDYDPLDVYVWLFIGIQWRLWTLATRPRPDPRTPK